MGSSLTMEQKAPYCAGSDSPYQYQLKYDNPYWHEYFNIVLFCSGTLFLGIFLQIIFKKQLQSHPAPLIAVQCLAESILCYMGVSRYWMCGEYGESEWLLAATVFFDTSYDS